MRHVPTPRLAECAHAGTLSQLQVETVRAAMDALGARRVFALGDGTGVGKARTLAGVIAEWRATHGAGGAPVVWVSANLQLHPFRGQPYLAVPPTLSMPAVVQHKYKMGSVAGSSAETYGYYSEKPSYPSAVALVERLFLKAHGKAWIQDEARRTNWGEMGLPTPDYSSRSSHPLRVPISSISLVDASLEKEAAVTLAAATAAVDIAADLGTAAADAAAADAKLTQNALLRTASTLLLTPQRPLR